MLGNYIVPLLYTRGLVILPGQELTFDIGRSDNIAAVDFANENNSYIFITSQKDIDKDNPSLDEIYKVGTLCKVQRYRKKDGYIRCTFFAQFRAKIKSTNSIEGHITCDVEIIEDICSDEEVLANLVDKTLSDFDKIKQYLNQSSLMQLSNKNIGALELCNFLGQVLINDLKEKQAFLEEVDLIKRYEIIIENIHKRRYIFELDSQIEQRVRENIEENQKDFYLREKMKAIKEELNDGGSMGDIDSLKELVMNNPYPQNVKNKALEELSKLEMLPASSGEFGVVRTYLDWLLKTPWYQKSKDNDDLNKAREILDEDHFGLEKVKERILEYLAVKQMTNNLKSPIICLVGPPGVGKTSLAKSVARALDRKFVKASLGGVKDESEIRGHRRTYLGSLPGRIIQGMKKAGTLNPVFLIDEIDKMASDYKGDPSSAMLEVLDPEQNSMFSDHYLEEPYDLSDVMFIATANYIENIPAALKDRLEIINLSSYTELEKINIAKEHLVSKQIKANGLKASQIQIDDDIILYLIRHYTRETGVRQLERIIGTLCRKTVLEILSNNKKKVKITKKLVNEWLGHEIFDYGIKEKDNQVGVVTGLAYTSFGGDVLQVEVNYFEGNGKFVVTGQLGDVMKESTQIALDYIKSNAKKYKIDPEFFTKHDIHIHVPEGAVPKDGPSAGVTLTTAIISAITNQAVYADLAMTGEVTLRGHVLPIGGLKEKSLAAHRSGIKTILFPKKNIKDLDEVPDTVKEDITFIPVSEMSDVLKHALVK